MAAAGNKIALFYDEDAYTEMLGPPLKETTGGPIGLMGRQVAGKEFLDAYLSHGSWTEMVAIVRSRAAADGLLRLCELHPSSRTRRRGLQIVQENSFHQSFFPTPPAPLLYVPYPPEAKYVWARQHAGPGAFAVCGVTHTLCSTSVAETLCQMVTAPFESFDALVCTSHAVVSVVRALTENYCDYLRERLGGAPRLRARLELIPLGVDTERFRPPTVDERRARRQMLGISDDEIVVLFVGRLSHHAKAHPFPMFHGLSQAARATGKKVHLLLAGWAAAPEIQNAFLDGARVFAPNVRVSMIDGTDPRFRFAVWQAADLFTSLVDNIQETFGLVIVEAMASGLPVIATDWNGYRDLVLEGETGYLIPTMMVRDATRNTTSRLLIGEMDYDHFLAECSQTVAVDCRAAAEAFARLLGDAALRQSMGEAGRQQALAQFGWQHIVRAYENLWQSQEEERLAWCKNGQQAPKRNKTPTHFPAPEFSFASYPTCWLADDDWLETKPGAEQRLEQVLQLPLTNHVSYSRCSDRSVLATVLGQGQTPCQLGQLESLLAQAGVSQAASRATLAWMLKYDLLQRRRGKR
jgi:glycosyltransferase involved in cell wall biosynthesis